MIDKLKIQLQQIKANYTLSNPQFQQTYLHFEAAIKEANETDVPMLAKTLKRYRRELENEIKSNQTDYHAFVKKWKTMGIPFVPLVYDIKLDFSKKITNLKYEDLINVNFNHHHYTSREMIGAGKFRQYQVLNKLDISREQFEKLLVQINLNYNIVSYHNFTHAFALFQLLFTCYEISDLKHFVTPTDLFAALLACLAHDVNHKGVNNLYKIKKAKLQNKFINEQAVLESMHAATFFNILALNPELDFLQQMPNHEARMEIKRIIITCILATDMGQHFQLTQALEERVEATVKMNDNSRDESSLTKYRAFKKDNFEDRKVLLNALVHACDISNPCLEWDSYMKWSFLLSQEFHDQTIKEAQNGLEVTTMFQYKDKVTFYNGQTFFLSKFVQPLWDGIALMFPGLICLPQEVKRNLEIVEQEKQKCQK